VVTAVLRFDPFSHIDAFTRSWLTGQTGSARSPRFMPMNPRVEDHYVLTCDLPGVDGGSVDVNVDNGTLTVTAHRTAQPAEDAVQWLANERFFGTYRRQLSLGEGIDASAISATYENGVLSITIPLTERAKPRRIEVTNAGSTRSIAARTVESP
jgi:HSP20 family protein